jgi:hypothetical protein
MPEPDPALELDRTLIRSPVDRQEPSFGLVPPLGLSHTDKGPYGFVGRDRCPLFGLCDLDFSYDWPAPPETGIGRSFQSDAIARSVDKPDWNPSHLLHRPICRRRVMIEGIERDLSISLSGDDWLPGPRLGLLVSQCSTGDPRGPRGKKSGGDRDCQRCDGHFRSLREIGYSSSWTCHSTPG